MYDNRPKFGHPRSNEERKKRHKALYGTTKLPPRGTGKRMMAGMSEHRIEQGHNRKEIRVEY